MTDDFADDFRSNPEPPRASLWLEGFRDLYRHWPLWIIWVAGFFLVTSLFYVAVFDPAILQVTYKVEAAQIAQDKALAKEQAGLLLDLFRHDAWIYAVLFFILMIQYYCYMTLFLKQQPVFGAPILGIGRFFYTEWKRFQILLIMVGLLILLALLCVLAFKLFVPLAVVIAIVSEVFYIYVAFKFYLVMPLAICGIKPALRISWDLIKGNWWRLLGNSSLFMVLVVVFYLIVILIEKVIIGGMDAAVPGTLLSPPDIATIKPVPAIFRFISLVPNHPYGLPTAYLSLVFGCLNGSLILVAVAAYRSSVFRILYRERNQVPS